MAHAPCGRGARKPKDRAAVTNPEIRGRTAAAGTGTHAGAAADGWPGLRISAAHSGAGTEEPEIQGRTAARS